MKNILTKLLLLGSLQCLNYMQCSMLKKPCSTSSSVLTVKAPQELPPLQISNKDKFSPACKAGTESKNHTGKKPQEKRPTHIRNRYKHVNVADIIAQARKEVANQTQEK